MKYAELIITGPYPYLGLSLVVALLSHMSGDNPNNPPIKIGMLLFKKNKGPPESPPSDLVFLSIHVIFFYIQLLYQS